jgi:hypothetical protein
VVAYKGEECVVSKAVNRDGELKVRFPGGVRALAEPGLPARLQHLNLARNDLYADEIRALAEAGLPAGLQHLNLASNALGPGGTRALAEAGLPSGLRHLDLTGNGIGEEEERAVRETFPECEVSS